MVRAFSKPVGEGFSRMAEILVLLEGLLQAKALWIYDLLVGEDFTVVIWWKTKKERGLQKFDGWFCQMFDIFWEFGCSFFQPPN